MTLDSAALTATGLVATVLSLVFAYAAHASARRRQKERAAVRDLVSAQTSPSVADPAPFAPAEGAAAPVAAQPPRMADRTRPSASQPVFVPPSNAPSPTDLLHPQPAVRPMFKRYVTRPESPEPAPLQEGESPPSREFIWE